MNNQQKWYKKLIVAALAVTIGISGGLLSAPSSAEAAISSSARANHIISFGDNYLGAPYKFGAAAGQTRNFDCSSFTQYVFKKNGINIPRSSKQQVKLGHFVAKSQLKKGDLVFFSVPGKPGVINHVAIYAGNGVILRFFLFSESDICFMIRIPNAALADLNLQRALLISGPCRSWSYQCRKLDEFIAFF
jgi:cell wall-associated NlpC family hydrolase